MLTNVCGYFKNCKLNKFRKFRYRVSFRDFCFHRIFSVLVIAAKMCSYNILFCKCFRKKKKYRAARLANSTTRNSNLVLDVFTILVSTPLCPTWNRFKNACQFSQNLQFFEGFCFIVKIALEMFYYLLWPHKYIISHTCFSKSSVH
jgi:hypothetical protein